MNYKVFKKIVKEAESLQIKLAKKNGWLWFFNLHQKEVMKFAEKLLKIYKNADSKQVLVSCWLHDVAHYYCKNDKEILRDKKEHHINGAEIAEKILQKYKVPKEEISKIKNCILRHRNLPDLKPRTLEEKIVVVADTLSHFGSVFYFTYFKFHPDHSIEQMVKSDLAKIRRDWRDLGLLPKSRKLVFKQYNGLINMLNNYGK